jgi:hypothetical protein
MKLKTIALASALAMSSTFALAQAPVRREPPRNLQDRL